MLHTAALGVCALIGQSTVSQQLCVAHADAAYRGNMRRDQLGYQKCLDGQRAICGRVGCCNSAFACAPDFSKMQCYCSRGGPVRAAAAAAGDVTGGAEEVGSLYTEAEGRANVAQARPTAQRRQSPPTWGSAWARTCRSTYRSG